MELVKGLQDAAGGKGAIIVSMLPNASRWPVCRTASRAERTGAILESRARRRALLWQRDRPSNWRLVGIESGFLSLHGLLILSSLPESFRYVFIGGSQSIDNGWRICCPCLSHNRRSLCFRVR